MKQPVVVEGKPLDSSGFDAFETDGITVYVRRDISVAPGGLRIRLLKMLFLVEMLTVEGIAA